MPMDAARPWESRGNGTVEKKSSSKKELFSDRSWDRQGRRERSDDQKCTSAPPPVSCGRSTPPLVSGCSICAQVMLTVMIVLALSTMGRLEGVGDPCQPAVLQTCSAELADQNDGVTDLSCSTVCKNGLARWVKSCAHSDTPLKAIITSLHGACKEGQSMPTAGKGCFLFTPCILSTNLLVSIHSQPLALVRLLLALQGSATPQRQTSAQRRRTRPSLGSRTSRNAKPLSQHSWTVPEQTVATMDL